MTEVFALGPNSPLLQPFILQSSLYLLVDNVPNHSRMLVQLDHVRNVPVSRLAMISSRLSTVRQDQKPTDDR